MHCSRVSFWSSSALMRSSCVGCGSPGTGVSGTSGSTYTLPSSEKLHRVVKGAVNGRVIAKIAELGHAVHAPRRKARCWSVGDTAKLNNMFTAPRKRYFPDFVRCVYLDFNHCISSFSQSIPFLFGSYFYPCNLFSAVYLYAQKRLAAGTNAHIVCVRIKTSRPASATKSDKTAIINRHRISFAFFCIKTT